MVQSGRRTVQMDQFGVGFVFDDSELTSRLDKLEQLSRRDGVRSDDLGNEQAANLDQTGCRSPSVLVEGHSCLGRHAWGVTYGSKGD